MLTKGGVTMEENKAKGVVTLPLGDPPAAVGRRRALGIARMVSFVGIMAATIEFGKLALAALPNIEVVSLLCALFSYVFGGIGFLATVVFVCIEPMIWGVGPWVVSYFIYWPTLSALFLLLGRRRVKNRVVISFIAVAMTVLFGVLTSLVEVGLFSGSYDNFLYRFGIYYLRGVWFYVAQIVTNAVLFPLLFHPLSRLLKRVDPRGRGEL
jgi:hypothetical protein